jgi:hypothetical protein
MKRIEEIYSCTANIFSYTTDLGSVTLEMTMTIVWQATVGCCYTNQGKYALHNHLGR